MRQKVKWKKEREDRDGKKKINRKSIEKRVKKATRREKTGYR